MSPNPLLAGLPPSHPGEILAEFMIPAAKAEHGVTKSAIAEHLGMSRQALDKLLKGQSPISPETALRLGKLFGNGPEFWMRLQGEYDLKLAQARLGATLDQLPTLTAA